MRARSNFDACPRRRGFVPALVACLAIATTARAADLYVDAGAQPGGDGTMAAPFDELQPALDVAAPGDTIHVLPGTYAPIRTRVNGAEGQRITVVAEPSRQAIVQVAADDVSALAADHTHHSFIGVVFDEGYHHRDAIVADGADHLELIDVEVRRADRDCIDLRTTSDVLIEGSYIHHCVNGADGAQVDAHGVTGDSVFRLTIRDTEIYMVTGDSLQLSPPREPWDEILVERCHLWNAPLDEAASSLPVGANIGENAVDTKVGEELNGSGMNPRLTIVDTVAHGWQSGISNQAAFNLKEDVDAVVDRVTVFDSEIAFRLRHPARVRVQNAVIYAVARAYRLEDGLDGAHLLASTLGEEIGTAFQDAGGDPVGLVTRNLLFLGGSVPAPADADPSNMFVGTEVFVDAAGHDYRLLAGSAPVDAGEALAEVTVDRIGVARPVGAGYDVGAFEYTDAPPPDPTTGGETGETGEPGTSSTAGTTGGDETTTGTGASDGATGAPTTGGGGTTPGTGTSAGTEATAASDTSAQGGGEAGGCGCTAPSRQPSGWLALALLLGLRRRVRPVRWLSGQVTREGRRFGGPAAIGAGDTPRSGAPRPVGGSRPRN